MPVKKERLTKKDRFLIRKYQHYIIKAIRRLANRDPESCFWDDNSFNERQRLRRQSDELIIDEASLFKSFLEVAKEENIHDVDPYIFAKPLKDW